MLRPTQSRLQTTSKLIDGWADGKSVLENDAQRVGITPTLRGLCCKKGLHSCLMAYKVLYSDESELCMSFRLEEPRSRVKRHRLEAAWGPLWRFCYQWWLNHVICWWCPLYFIKAKVRACHAFLQISRGCWFNFPAVLGICPHCFRYQ